MKRMWVLILLLAEAVPQTGTKEKPCIAFSPESTSPSNALAKEPLEASVMLSGDFDFFAARHEGCWNVHVLSLPLTTAKGKPMGFAISHTVTDPKDMEVGHALTLGPDRDIFTQAMRKATADAIRNIRLARSDLEPPRTQQLVRAAQ
ncbi:MAG TPA: hypothetical protein VFE61_06675 [Candidatus Sulfotelmatobacter sp.]|nr:hypothetical protein [Candidatus Sulfotelmatobacter sp.]